MVHVRGNLDVKGSKITERFAHIRDERSLGTNNTDLTSNTWNKRTLNTVVGNDFAGLSVSNSQITLPAGTYYVEAWAPSYKVRDNRLRLYNVTAGAEILRGRNVSATSSGGNTVITARLQGIISGSISSVIELQHISSQSVFNLVDGGGRACNITGTNEIYAEIIFTNYA